MSIHTHTRETVALRDQHDPIAYFRNQFFMPEGLIYLDGNSLGPLPKRTAERINYVTHVEWGERLIRSWNQSGWMEMSWRVGDKIAKLIGAEPGEVICADSTSVNVFKTLSAALKMRPDRKVILSTHDNFPTDLYMIQGLIDLLGRKHQLKLVDGEEIGEHLNEDVAVMTFTHVNYKTGRMYDMKGLTARSHEVGALAMWDLAHTAGAVSCDLNGANADFAVGCGYKYLNGGPGASAFLMVAQRHQSEFTQPLSGWLGHAAPFAFEWKYEPAEGIGRYMCGTPPVLSMSALECGVDILLEADMKRIRTKSLELSDLFIELVESRCARHGLKLVTPRKHDIRGSQASFSHPEGYAIMQALVANGVIGDFRAPDILRFGFTPLYVRYIDVWDAVERLSNILDSREWDKAEYKQRKKVT